MIVDRSREKLLNALIYFSGETLYAGKTKLFKLLYFLDFSHFQEVGRPVTNLEYFAWPQGPVPVELFEEWSHPRPDFIKALAKGKRQLGNGDQREELKPRVAFNPRIFSKREMRIMESLARTHRRHNAADMVEATHLETTPWHQVYEVDKRAQSHIPYGMALSRKGDDSDVMALAREHSEFHGNYE